MKRNERFEGIIQGIKLDDKILTIPEILEYVKINVDANMFYFFTGDTDEEVEILNNEFIKYLTEV